MPVYEIEQGQGVTSKIGTFQVVTTTLYTCTFIGASGGNGKRSGAFHYPAEGRNYPEIVKAMNNWIGDIEPNQICIVFAEGSGHMGSGTGREDKEWLKQWGRTQCMGGLVRTGKATSAMVSVANNLVDAGERNQFDIIINQQNVINLKTKGAGVYIFMGPKAEFTLFGRNMENG